MLSCLFIAALWSPTGKGLTSWLTCVVCDSLLCFVTFPYGVLGQVWYLIGVVSSLAVPGSIPLRMSTGQKKQK